MLGQHQIRAYTRGATVPAYTEADWAMALDPDEFLVVRTGGGTLSALSLLCPKVTRCGSTGGFSAVAAMRF